MKLRYISENTLAELRGERRISYITNQTAHDLAYDVMAKLRRMLIEMGLTKGKGEPLGPAVTSFALLRQFVQLRVNADAEFVQTHGLDDPRVQAIGKYWGYMMPNAQSTSPGTVTTGEFDQLLADAIEEARDKSTLEKLDVLHRLASLFTGSVNR